MVRGRKEREGDKQVTLEKVIEEIGRMYAKALTLKYVQKPLSWSLYQVWKMVDAWEKENGKAD